MLTELETMKATIAMDDELFAAAQEYAGDKEQSAVISEALKAFVEREATRRRARMGGSAPDAKAPPRRRFGERSCWKNGFIGTKFLLY